MNLKSIFTTNAIISFCFGVGFMAIPGFILKIICLPTDSEGEYLTRFLGIMIFGLSVLVFKARNISDPIAIRAILTFLVLCYGLMLCFHVPGQLFFSKGNIMLWALDIVHVVFVGIYTSFLLKQEDELVDRIQIEEAI
jgi:hypothetical protein